MINESAEIEMDRAMAENPHLRSAFLAAYEHNEGAMGEHGRITGQALPRRRLQERVDSLKAAAILRIAPAGQGPIRLPEK